MRNKFILLMDDYIIGIYDSLTEAKREKQEILKVFIKNHCEDCRKIKLTIRQKVFK